MRHPLAGISLLIWILWAQWYGVGEVNDKVMLFGDSDGVWRYQEAFDAKAQCQTRRRQLIDEQETALAALTVDQDLSGFRYKVWRCYPETINPHELTRARDW